MSVSRRGTIRVLVAAGVLALLSLLHGSAAVRIFVNTRQPKDDPYKVLGVDRTASDEAIQKAYRQKARETHPDKNPSPDASEQFRRVTDAFDLLGDPAQRRRLDARWNQEAQQRRRREQQRRQKEQQRQREERQREEARRQRERQEDKERQRRHRVTAARARATRHRVLKISSLEKFEATVLDSERKVYERHTLIMFVSNKNAERKADEELFFPYPFAGEDAGDDSYAGILRIAKVRFNTQTELTKLFRATRSNVPHVVFARRGDAPGMFRTFNYDTRRGADVHSKFQMWVRPLLHVAATVANRHALPIDYLVLRGSETVHRGTLEPGYQTVKPLLVTSFDRVVAFDRRLDAFPGGRSEERSVPNAQGVLLMDEVVKFDGTYTIRGKRCYDLSVQCEGWMRKQQCQNNPEFMHHLCPYTCGVCAEHFASDLAYFALHCPIHRLPLVLQGAVRSGRPFLDDIRQMLKLRKNVAFALFLVGLLVPCNLLLFRPDARTRTQLRQNTKDPYANLIFYLNLILLVLAVTVCTATAWMVLTPARAGPPWLRSLHIDVRFVGGDPEIFMLLLAIGVLASAYFNKLLHSLKHGLKTDQLLFFGTALLTLVSSVATALSFKMSSDEAHAIRWQQLWNYRKNSAFLIFVTGMFGGTIFFSLRRLLKAPQIKTALLVILSNVILLAAVGGVIFMDVHFKEDLMHVIELRKNAAFACFVFGILAGCCSTLISERWISGTLGSLDHPTGTAGRSPGVVSGFSQTATPVLEIDRKTAKEIF